MWTPLCAPFGKVGRRSAGVTQTGASQHRSFPFPISSLRTVLACYEYAYFIDTKFVIFMYSTAYFLRSGFERFHIVGVCMFRGNRIQKQALYLVCYLKRTELNSVCERTSKYFVFVCLTISASDPKPTAACEKKTSSGRPRVEQ